MLPTYDEALFIALIIAVVLVAGRLFRLGDALGRFGRMLRRRR